MKIKMTDKQKVQEMIETRTTAMLVTHDKQGGLVSRPMTTQQPEDDGDVWFFASSDSDVIDEIEAHSDVNISYMSDGKFLSINGEAQLIDDTAKKKELWYDELAKWFNGQEPSSPDVKLIKVTSDTARFWDTSGDKEPEVEIINY